MTVRTGSLHSGGIFIVYGFFILFQINLHTVTGGAEFHFIGIGQNRIEACKGQHTGKENQQDQENIFSVKKCGFWFDEGSSAIIFTYCVFISSRH